VEGGAVEVAGDFPGEDLDGTDFAWGVRDALQLPSQRDGPQVRQELSRWRVAHGY